MFKKLLSNLPFNPSLLGQVSFYTERLRGESFVRGAGIVTIALALLVQTFAIVSPPERSLATGGNDIIAGGFERRDQATQYCQDPSRDTGRIFQYYGITCEIISTASTRYIKSTDYDKRLDSLGRVPQPAKNPKNGKPSDQYAVQIPGVDQLYMKNLWYWDSRASSTYKVLEMTNIYGQTIFILYDCGNIVTIDKFTPPPPPPTPNLTQVCVKLPDGTFLKTGQAEVNANGWQRYVVACETPVTTVTTTTPPPVKEVPDACPNIPGKQTSTDQCDVCPNIPGTQSTQNECYPCPAAQTDTTATACLAFDKTATNLTRGIANANKTTARPADVITYTLTVNNVGTTEHKDFVFEENLIDVLQYSTMNDYGGATLSPTKQLVWPKRNIPAGKSISVKFNVKVMSPIPQTPQPASDPGSYDLCMTNVFYGKTIQICVEPPTSKQIETVATTLPNTGPGTSLMIGFGVITLMGYFYARNKVMIEELDIVRHEYAKGGMA